MSNPEVEGSLTCFVRRAPEAGANPRNCDCLWCSDARRSVGPAQRHEGSGAGNGVRLHERNKASEGESHGRIWHEKGPAGSERIKASRGWENLKAQTALVRQAFATYVAARCGETSKGDKPQGRQSSAFSSFLVDALSAARVWMISVGAGKPKRGFPSRFHDQLGIVPPRRP